jgi:hypothetical protein
MVGKVRRVNLWLDRAMMGLHVNSQDKRKLTHLIAKGISGGHASSVSSIPFIIYAKASPFLA